MSVTVTLSVADAIELWLVTRRVARNEAASAANFGDNPKIQAMFQKDADIMNRIADTLDAALMADCRATIEQV